MSARGRVVNLLLAGLLAGGAGPGRAAARTPAWVEAGPALGGLGLDRDLARYRWDTGPATQWGGRVLAGRGPLALGLGAWRSGTTQETGLTDGTPPLAVSLSTVALVGLARVATPFGCEVRLGVQAGRLHASWDPGSLSVTTGGGAKIDVAFEDIDEWCYGANVEVQRDLGRGLAAALQGEWTRFALDTAHRSGDAIEQERERFGTWAVRLQMAWRWSRQPALAPAEGAD